jgi:hypothetical protein
VRQPTEGQSAIATNSISFLIANVKQARWAPIAPPFVLPGFRLAHQT